MFKSMQNMIKPTINIPQAGSILYQLSQEQLEFYGMTVAKTIAQEIWEKVQAPSVDAARHYTRAECCKILRCSLPTFHALANKGLIPVTKVGRKTLIPAAEFDSIVASGQLARYKHHPMKKEGGAAYGR